MTTKEKMPVNRYLSSYLINHMQDKARMMDAIIRRAKEYAEGYRLSDTHFAYSMGDEERLDYFKAKLYNTLLHAQIEPTPDQWGSCNACNGIFSRWKARPLYRVKRYSIPNNEEIRYTKAACKDHISNRLWMEVMSMHNPFDFSFFDQEKDFPEPDPLNQCAACGEDMLPRMESNSLSWTPFGDAREVDAMGSDGKVYIVHQSCSYTCESDNGKHVWSGGRHYTGTIGTTTKWINNLRICPTHYDEVVDEHKTIFNCDVCDREFTDEYAKTSHRMDDIICAWCYDEEYWCDNCEAWFRDVTDHDDDYSCNNEDDDDDSGSSYVMSYSYKPAPIFNGKSTKNLFFGLELEVEYRGNLYDGFNEGAEKVHSHLNDGGNRFYLKYDGSLQNGFEIVSHPHTLEKFQQTDWSILDWMMDNKWRSWDTGRCGIHVHVSRDAFDPASDNQRDTHQIKFIKLIYDNKQHVQRLSGRRSSWAKFDDKGKIVRKVKTKYQSDGRYSAVNVEPSQTIEVRVFKGSLRKERVLACIEFVHAAVEYTRDLPVVYTDSPFAWTSFMSYVFNNRKTYPNLMVILNELMAQSTNSANNVEGEDD